MFDCTIIEGGKTNNGEHRTGYKMLKQYLFEVQTDKKPLPCVHCNFCGMEILFAKVGSQTMKKGCLHSSVAILCFFIMLMLAIVNESHCS